MKKGQATVFIILAIIIVVIIGIVYYFRESLVSEVTKEEVVKGVEVSREIQEVSDYVANCVQDVGKTGIEYVLAQGGWFDPVPFYNQGGLVTGYWYYEGEDSSPSIEEVELEIAKFVDFYLTECIFEFENPEMLIVQAEPETKVQISKNKITMYVVYPAVVEYKDTFFSIPETPFYAEFNSDLKKVYDAGRQVVKMQQKDPKYIDVTMLTKLGPEVTYIPGTKSEGVYLISGSATNLMFANKYKVGGAAEE